MNQIKDYICTCTHKSVFENIKRCDGSNGCNCIICINCMYDNEKCEVYIEQNKAIECFEKIINEGVFILHCIKDKNIIINLKKELENANMFINEIKLQNEVYYEYIKTDILIDNNEILDEISFLLKKRIEYIIQNKIILPPNFYTIN